MKWALIAIVVLVGSAHGDPGGAFCELTPCIPGPVTRRTLAADEPAGKLTCKRGQELGVDAKQRLVFCTTAKPADADGVPVAANAYTLFHPSGRIYQTHARAKFTTPLADGSKVTCGPDLVALHDDGHLRYCKLAAPRPGSPRARVGEGLELHRDGRVLALTLDEPFVAGALALPAGASIVWDANGKLAGGYSSAPITSGALSIRYDFTLYPDGALHAVELAAPAKLQGRDFPQGAELVFRPTGTVERAKYVDRRGFMPHGEEWTDTLFLELDPTGKVTSSRTEHWQSKIPERKWP